MRVVSVDTIHGSRSLFRFNNAAAVTDKPNILLDMKRSSFHHDGADDDDWHNLARASGRRRRDRDNMLTRALESHEDTYSRSLRQEVATPMLLRGSLRAPTDEQAGLKRNWWLWRSAHLNGSGSAENNNNNSSSSSSSSSSRVASGKKKDGIWAGDSVYSRAIKRYEY